MCSVEGCEKKILARALCKNHYMYLYRHGNVVFDKHKTHKLSKHHLYSVWHDIKDRCYNLNNKRYKDYGGRGIKVCEEWMSPSVFLEWALPLWKKGLQLDRIDNDGDYSPGNCHFVAQIENLHNRKLLQRNNVSGYRGVSYYPTSKKWVVCIGCDGKQKHLGYFNSPRTAALRYDAEAFLLNDGRPMNFIEKII